MKLLVIAYPELSKKDFSSIESFRKENDRMFSIVRPHFTFVFPSENITIPDLIHELDLLLEHEKAIFFSLRCASLCKDDFNDYYHCFLVPDEGFSQIVKLHDKLYSRLLKRELRLDINYLPHIGVGNSKDPLHCKRMVDKWNEKDFEINGTISYLTIIKYENETIETIESFQLK